MKSRSKNLHNPTKLQKQDGGLINARFHQNLLPNTWKSSHIEQIRDFLWVKCGSMSRFVACTLGAVQQGGTRQVRRGCSLEKNLRYSPNHPSLCLYYSEICLGPIPGETLVQTQIRSLLYILAVGGSQLPRGTGLFPVSFHLEETQTHPELATDTSLRLLGLRYLMFVPSP